MLTRSRDFATKNADALVACASRRLDADLRSVPLESIGIPESCHRGGAHVSILWICRAFTRQSIHEAGTNWTLWIHSGVNATETVTVEAFLALKRAQITHYMRAEGTDVASRTKLGMDVSPAVMSDRSQKALPSRQRAQQR